MAASYAKGELDPPLLEQTIGENFEATVAAHPDREALVEFATGRRWTWAELNRDVDALAIGLIRAGIGKGDRVGMWSPNCAEWTLVQYATAKIGAILVNVNPAYRTHELSYALRQSGTKLLISATEFKTQQLPGDGRGGARRHRVAGAGVVPRQPRVDRPQRPRPRRDPARGDDVVAVGRRPDQHPVHVGHHRLPEGRHAQPPQHPQQRLPDHRADQLHRGGPALHPRALLPLLRHGDGQPRVHQPRRHDGDPGARLRPRDHAAGGRRREVHGGLRRPDHVHRDAEPPDLRRPRPVQPAHRDHGRVDLPGRGDEALHQRHAHARGRHRLRHDRDLAGLLPDPGRRRPGPAYLLDRPGPPAPRDQDRRPGHRRDRRAR